MRSHSLALVVLAGVLLPGQAQAEDLRLDADASGWRAFSHHADDAAPADYCVLTSGDQVDAIDGRKLKPIILFYRSPTMTITVGDPAWLLPTGIPETWIKIDVGTAYSPPLSVTWNDTSTIRTTLARQDASRLLTLIAQFDTVKIRIGQQSQVINLAGASRALAVFRACAGDLGASVLSNPLQDPIPLMDQSAEKTSK